MPDPAAPPTPVESPVDLRNRWAAGLLALLLPGLGHFYQRRRFKAVIYAVCVLGLFLSGQALGDWKVVYLGDSDGGGRIAASGLMRRLLQGYGAQFPVGVLAWPAILQQSRYYADDNNDQLALSAPIEAPFEGSLGVETANGPLLLLELTGTVKLEPVGGGIRGLFEGQSEDGTAITLTLDRVRELGRAISANEGRTLVAVPAATDQLPLPPGVTIPADASAPVLAGALGRPFWNRYQVPLGDQGEDRLTAELGAQRVEIAFVFTWIAGLLNILAIWDAIDGPAYGLGNEPEEPRPERKRRSWWRRKPKAVPSSSAPAAKPLPVSASS